MKLNKLFLLLLLTIAARADTISINFFTNPDTLPSPPYAGVSFYTFIQNNTENIIYLSNIYQILGSVEPVTPIESDGFVCILQPDYRYNHFCNQYNELAIAPYDNAFFKMGGIFGSGNPPGTYLWTLYVYGGPNGSNDFQLLGTDTAVVTVIPEPSTVVFMISGFIGLLGIKRYV